MIIDINYASSITTLVSFYPFVSDGMKKMIVEEVEMWCKITGWGYSINEKGVMDILTPEEAAPQNA